MAITKAINKKTNSHGAMKNCIEYVLRDSKIKDGLVYITGPFAAAELNYDTVYKAFLEEKKLWGKDTGRMYTHHVISFHKDEQITPEQAYEYGKEFADRWFKGFQCLVSVHQDKEHIHIHFVTNSVSYENGLKIHASAKDLANMKELTNKMCRERGLTIAEKGKHFDGTPIEQGQVSSWSKDKYMLLKEDAGKSFLVACMKALSKVMEDCMGKTEFMDRMKKEGWDVIWKDSKKNITFVNPAGDRVRDTNLSKTFQANICKEMLEKQFVINTEREDYYDKVNEAIDTPKTDSNVKPSLLKKLAKYKANDSEQPVNQKKRNRQNEMEL